MKKIWIAYFAVKFVLIADLELGGPISTTLSALTGLPVR